MQKVIVVGAGPVGALAALYAAQRGDNVEIYELRDGGWKFFLFWLGLGVNNSSPFAEALAGFNMHFFDKPIMRILTTRYQSCSLNLSFAGTTGFVIQMLL